MNNRLPPAWPKHIKPGPTPKPNLPTANSLSRGQADEALLKQADALQQAKRLNEAQDLCLRVLSRTPNHPLALYILGTICLGYEDEAALRYFARAVDAEPKNPYYHRAAPSNSTLPMRRRRKHDRTGDRAVRQLSPSVVAQMTRFGLTQEALVNHQPRRNRLFPAESGDRRTVDGQGIAAEPPHLGRRQLRPLLFFHIMTRAC